MAKEEETEDTDKVRMKSESADDSEGTKPAAPYTKAEEEAETEDKCKKKKKKKAVDSEEEESEDEVEKDTFGGNAPTEAAQANNQAGNTLSPNAGVPSTQNVFVPASGVHVAREGSAGGSSTGRSPSDVTYGKSASPDLMKSPLFVSLSGQLDEMQKSIFKKIESIEKSMNDRVANLKKSIEEVEKFKEQSFNKAISENVTPEAMSKDITKQIEQGKVRYSF